MNQEVELDRIQNPKDPETPKYRNPNLITKTANSGSMTKIGISVAISETKLFSGDINCNAILTD